MTGTEIISFNKGNGTTATDVNISKKGAQVAVLKYTTSDNLPSSEDKSVLIYTTDTSEFYQGQGYATPLLKISTDNIFFADSKSGFPTSGQSKSKLYVAKDTEVIYMYTDNGYIAISNGSGSTIDPAIITQLQTDVGLKADKTDLVNYRSTSTKIAATDLDSDITAVLSSIPAAYDDTAVKANIATLGSNKADKTDLTAYRKVVDAIKESDLDTVLAAKIDAAGTGTGTPYDDTIIKAEIVSLQDNKADKTTLADYRKGTDTISLSDLDGTLATIINDKAEKTDLTAFRKIADKIIESDLDTTLIAKVDAIGTPYDDTTVKAEIKTLQDDKADKTDLVNFRKINDKIIETDLDSALIAKIDAVGTPYNDTTVKADIKTLQDNKADKTDLANYRSASTKIAVADLDTDVTTKLNSIPAAYNDTDIKTDITSLQNNAKMGETLLAAKANTTDLVNYRKTADAIKESDLDTATQEKLNTVASGSGDKIIEYEVVNSTNGECIVVATGAGISLSKGTAPVYGSNNSETYPLKVLTIPAGVRILSARIRFYNTEISETTPGCAVDWDATQDDNTDNNFVQPLCQVWNDAPPNRTLRQCAMSQSVNNHTVTFNGLATGGDSGVGCLVKLIY